MKQARTRFAPSPTGYLHVGGVRTALFAWLLARQSGGQFILRLEDTDKAREVAGSGQHIMDSLRWLGLDWDEGIDVGGQYGPYKQSERLETYKEWAQKLVDKGRAYADPYTPDEVNAFREAAKANKKPFLYRNHRPENPPAWDGSSPLRFKSEPKPYNWHDAVMGDLATGEESIDDFILMKSDGYPTYNFAHIIDDMLMKCTHVLRSQEFIPSVPNYLNLYEALDIERPILGILPYVMGPDGKKKLGKRDGAKDVLDYAREGYLPEAMRNFIASLGWNDGTEQEIFSTQELVEKFSLDHVHRGGAKFDKQRLTWMNGAHIRALSLDDLYARCQDFWPAEAATYDDGYRRQVLSLIQERLKFLAELPELTLFFFKDLPVNPSLWTENKQLKKLSGSELKQLLQQARQSLGDCDFTVDCLNAHLNGLLESTGQRPGVLFSLIRIATTQAPASPALAESLNVLTKDVALHRIDTMLAAL
ncbi:MAG TPA: glutamate--tRNA ligase [Bacillota bacterium]|nr:glutamate--tRNA ligase [Bacillota bacterium]